MVLALEKYALTDEALTRPATDRRRAIRVRQHRPVKVFEPASNRYVGGQTCDVSSTGLRLELPLWTHLTPGRVVSVHIGASDRGQSLANRRQMIAARVVWVNRDVENRQLTAGVEFTTAVTARLDAA